MSAILPPNTPLVDNKGLVRPEWYRFFVAIQKDIGDTVLGLDDIQVLEGGLSNAAVRPIPDVLSPALLLSVPPQSERSSDNLSPPSIAIPAADPLIPPCHYSAQSVDLLYPPSHGA